MSLPGSPCEKMTSRRRYATTVRAPPVASRYASTSNPRGFRSTDGAFRFMRLARLSLRVRLVDSADYTPGRLVRVGRTTARTLFLASVARSRRLRSTCRTWESFDATMRWRAGPTLQELLTYEHSNWEVRMDPRDRSVRDAPLILTVNGTVKSAVAGIFTVSSVASSGPSAGPLKPMAVSG